MNSDMVKCKLKQYFNSLQSECQSVDWNLCIFKNVFQMASRKLEPKKWSQLFLSHDEQVLDDYFTWGKKKGGDCRVIPHRMCHRQRTRENCFKWTLKGSPRTLSYLRSPHLLSTESSRNSAIIYFHVLKYLRVKYPWLRLRWCIPMMVKIGGDKYHRPEMRHFLGQSSLSCSHRTWEEIAFCLSSTILHRKLFE